MKTKRRGRLFAAIVFLSFVCRAGWSSGYIQTQPEYVLETEIAAQNVSEEDWVKEGKKLFKDRLMTKLKRKVSIQQIEACRIPEMQKLARSLYENEYSLRFRVNTFEPVYSPEALGRLMHIGNGYSTFQHVTGIVLSPGKHVVVVEGLKAGSEMGLKVAELYAPEQGDRDWSLHRETYSLKNGVNIIEKKSDWTGLAYIDYYFDNPEKEKDVKVHFVNGTVNGYFDASKDSNEEWDKLLSEAVYPVFDAVGSNVHLAYPVKDLQKYASGKGKELLSVYETLVNRQYEIIGWVKYKHVPKNKIAEFNLQMQQNSD